MRDSFYSFGSILLEILNSLYRHLLAFYIEAGLFCKRRISFKRETQVKKHLLHFTSFSNVTSNSWCRSVIKYRRLPLSGYSKVFGYHLQKFSDSSSKTNCGSGKSRYNFDFLFLLESHLKYELKPSSNSVRKQPSLLAARDILRRVREKAFLTGYFSNVLWKLDW